MDLRKIGAVIAAAVAALWVKARGKEAAQAVLDAHKPAAVAAVRRAVAEAMKVTTPDPAAVRERIRRSVARTPNLPLYARLALELAVSAFPAEEIAGSVAGELHRRLFHEGERLVRRIEGARL